MHRFTSARVIALVVAPAVLAGCGLQGPTYGTGKAANVQLVEDVTSMINLTPDRAEPIAYQPRPELVQPPAAAANGTLPAPQENATNSEGWVESPEERRARYRDYATANRDDPNFRPVVSSPDYDAAAAPSAPKVRYSLGGVVPEPRTIAGVKTPEEQRADYRRRRKIATTGDADQRRYLSEPPTEYRQPAATAPNDDLGEDEKDKARRLAEEAGTKKKKRFIFF